MWWVLAPFVLQALDNSFDSANWFVLRRQVSLAGWWMLAIIICGAVNPAVPGASAGTPSWHFCGSRSPGLDDGCWPAQYALPQLGPRSMPWNLLWVGPCMGQLQECYAFVVATTTARSINRIQCNRNSSSLALQVALSSYSYCCT